MTTKDDLVDEARAVGVPDPDGLTKPQLEAAIESRVAPELGPVFGREDESFKQVGAGPGIQPQTADEIPEAGR